MTTKRDQKDKAKQDGPKGGRSGLKRPNDEVKDLDAKRQADQVKGGWVRARETGGKEVDT